MPCSFEQPPGPFWQHEGAADCELSRAADARRLALEAIATLINIKKTAADQLLRPAGVRDDLIRRFLTERDPATGERRSKREAGAIVLDELARSGEDAAVAEIDCDCRRMECLSSGPGRVQGARCGPESARAEWLAC
jgi:hypothetical protein